MARGSLNLGKSATLHGEVIYAKNTLDSVLSPTPLTGLSMPPTNPYYPGGGITPVNPAALAPDPTLPVSIGWRTTLAGGRASSFENVTDRYLVGVDGTVGTWDYQAAVFQSNSTVKNTFTGGYLNNTGIRNGMAGLNGAPFLNLFGPQTAAGTAYVQSQLILGQIQEATEKLTGVTAQAASEIWKLPAGPLPRRGRRVLQGQERIHQQLRLDPCGGKLRAGGCGRQLRGPQLVGGVRRACHPGDQEPRRHPGDPLRRLQRLRVDDESEDCVQMATATGAPAARLLQHRIPRTDAAGRVCAELTDVHRQPL